MSSINAGVVSPNWSTSQGSHNSSAVTRKVTKSSAETRKVTPQQENAIDSTVKVLTTSEKGFLWAIIERIRALFGSVTPGSAADLTRSTHLLAKSMLHASDLTKIDKAIDVFFKSLSNRVETLNLNPKMDKINVKMAAVFASRLIEEATEGKTINPAAKTRVGEKLVAFNEKVNPTPVEVLTRVEVQPGKSWTRRTVEVVSVASLFGATALGVSYWAGYDVSVITDLDLKAVFFNGTIFSDASSVALSVYNTVSNRSLAAVATAVSYVNVSQFLSLMPSVNISLPSLPSFEWPTWAAFSGNASNVITQEQKPAPVTPPEDQAPVTQTEEQPPVTQTEEQPSVTPPEDQAPVTQTEEQPSGEPGNDDDSVNRDGFNCENGVCQ